MAYKITNQRTGHHFTAKAGETVLDAAIRQGISLSYGCRSGLCGRCAGRLLQGSVDYADSLPEALDAQEPGQVIFCQALPTSDLIIDAHEIEAVSEIPIKRLPGKVAKIERLADDVIRLYIKLPEGERLQFLAGQYLDIIVNDKDRRAFSIANAPHDDDFIELHIRRVDNGGFSHFVFEQLQEKALIRFEAPLGTFFLREDSPQPMIFMAGGTGFAPIKGIIEHAFAEGIDRPMHLYWGVRKQCDLYMHELPAKWAREHQNFSYTPVLSSADEAWQGRKGPVHHAILQDYQDLSGHDIYASGPPIMVNDGFKDFSQHGLSQNNYFSDAFEFAHEQKQGS